MMNKNYNLFFSCIYTICSLICLSCLVKCDLTAGLRLWIGAAMFLFMGFSIVHSGKYLNIK